MDATTKAIIEVFFGTILLCGIFAVYVYLRRKNPPQP